MLFGKLGKGTEVLSAVRGEPLVLLGREGEHAHHHHDVYCRLHNRL